MAIDKTNIADLSFNKIADILAQSINHKVLYKFNKVEQYNVANNERKFIGIF